MGHMAPGADAADCAGALEFGEKSRLRQIVDWFGVDYDGVIVFDECHRAKNCVPKTKGPGQQSASESKTSRAVIELQRILPKARILYVSATGATDPENLLYMTRLGLWGPSTAFPCRLDFVKLLNARGVGAMELVALDLKRRGAFMARTLSWEGVEVHREDVKITDEFRAMYDAAVALWADVDTAIRGAREDGSLNGDQFKKARKAQFASQLRFFRQLCTAAKVPYVVELAKAALANTEREQCVVIGLQSTGEARTAAMVADAGGEDAEFATFVEPAGLIVQKLIEDNLPVSAPERASLLRRAMDMKLPENPLDLLIDMFGGPDHVAEMTGRKSRMVREGGCFRFRPRATDDTPLDLVNIEEKRAFQSDRKRVAIISDAASTGISLQADRAEANQRQRVHITLELAWSADKTVQQLGRTHRSNQRQPPLYLIVASDICGEQRFASAVARRLQQLGALTHGDRNAASASDALASSNLQTKYGKEALRKMYKTIVGRQGVEEGVTPDFMAEELQERGLAAGAPQWKAARHDMFKGFLQLAGQALNSVGVLDYDANSGAELNRLERGQTEQDRKKAEAKGDWGGINRFLNRLLAVKVDTQTRIFQYFMTLLAHTVQQAKRLNQYNETGVVVPAGAIRFKDRKVIFQCQQSGALTYHNEYLIDRGATWETVEARLAEEKQADEDTYSGFYYTRNEQFDTTFPVLAIERDERGRKVAVSKRFRRGHGNRRPPRYFRIVRPVTGFSSHDLSWDQMREKGYKEVPANRLAWFKGIWQKQYNNKRTERTVPLHLISGAILPLLPALDKSGTGRLQVFRVEPKDGSPPQIGLMIEPSKLPRVLTIIAEKQPERPWENAAIAAGPGASTDPAAAEDAAFRAAAAANAAALRGEVPADPKQATLTAAAGKGATSAAVGKENVAPTNSQDSVIDIDSSDVDDDEPVVRRVRKPRKKAARRGSWTKAPIVLDASDDEVVEVPDERAARLKASGLFEAVQLPGLKLKPQPVATAVASPPCSASPPPATGAGSGSLSESPAAVASIEGEAAAAAESGGAAATKLGRKRVAVASTKLSGRARRMLEAELSEHSDTEVSGEESASSSSESEAPDAVDSSSSEESESSDEEDVAAARARTAGAGATPAKGKAKRAAAVAAAAAAEEPSEAAAAGSGKDDRPAKRSRTSAAAGSNADAAVSPAATSAALSADKAGAAKLAASPAVPTLSTDDSDGSDAVDDSGSSSDEEPIAVTASRRRSVAAAGQAAGSSRPADSGEAASSGKRCSSSGNKADGGNGAVSPTQAGGTKRSAKAAGTRANEASKAEKAAGKATGKGEGGGAVSAGADNASGSAQHVILRNLEISGDWEVKCVCGVTDDDGEQMVECDACSIWQHTACVGLPAGAVPPTYTCTFCAAQPDGSTQQATSKAPAAAPAGKKQGAASKKPRVAAWGGSSSDEDSEDEAAADVGAAAAAEPATAKQTSAARRLRVGAWGETSSDDESDAEECGAAEADAAVAAPAAAASASAAAEAPAAAETARVSASECSDNEDMEVQVSAAAVAAAASAQQQAAIPASGTSPAGRSSPGGANSAGKPPAETPERKRKLQALASAARRRQQGEADAAADAAGSSRKQRKRLRKSGSGSAAAEQPAQGEAEAMEDDLAPAADAGGADMDDRVIHAANSPTGTPSTAGRSHSPSRSSPVVKPAAGPPAGSSPAAAACGGGGSGGSDPEALQRELAAAKEALERECCQVAAQREVTQKAQRLLTNAEAEIERRVASSVADAVAAAVVQEQRRAAAAAQALARQAVEDARAQAESQAAADTKALELGKAKGAAEARRAQQAAEARAAAAEADLARLRSSMDAQAAEAARLCRKQEAAAAVAEAATTRERQRLAAELAALKAAQQTAEAERRAQAAAHKAELESLRAALEQARHAATAMPPVPSQTGTPTKAQHTLAAEAAPAASPQSPWHQPRPCSQQAQPQPEALLKQLRMATPAAASRQHQGDSCGSPEPAGPATPASSTPPPPEAILQHLKATPGASAEKLATHFGCGRTDIAGVLCALEEDFEVYRSGAAYHIM